MWERWSTIRRQPVGRWCILFSFCNSFAQWRVFVLTLSCPVILLLSCYFKNSLNQVLMTSVRRETQCLVGKHLPSHPKSWGRWGSVDGLLMVRTGTPGIFISDFPMRHWICALDFTCIPAVHAKSHNYSYCIKHFIAILALKCYAIVFMQVYQTCKLFQWKHFLSFRHMVLGFQT